MDNVGAAYFMIGYFVFSAALGALGFPPDDARGMRRFWWFLVIALFSLACAVAWPFAVGIWAGNRIK